VLLSRCFVVLVSKRSRHSCEFALAPIHALLNWGKIIRMTSLSYIASAGRKFKAINMNAFARTWHISVLLIAALLPQWAQAASGLPEAQRFGFALPVDAKTPIWTNHITVRNIRDSVTSNGVEFISIDTFKNIGKGPERGVSAVNSTTRQRVWHTPFPSETTNSASSKDERQIESSTLIQRGNRLLCTYLVTPNVRAPKVRFWEFMILDTASGKVVRRERTKIAIPQVNFTIIGDYWFVTDERAAQTLRLEPGTGEIIWSHPDVLKFSTVTEKAISFYKRIRDDAWQVTALDLDTGKPLFNQRFERLDRHIVKGVLARDGSVFVELGAQYDWNLERGAMYRTYSVAFDAATARPLWRTPFFD
jgi:outer membrane protein assembly factor BamB